MIQCLVTTSELEHLVHLLWTTKTANRIAECKDSSLLSEYVNNSASTPFYNSDKA